MSHDVKTALSPSQWKDLLEDGDEIVTTVFSFKDAEVRQSTKGDLCLIVVSGLYSPPLAAKLDRLAREWPGHLGLDLSEFKVEKDRSARLDAKFLSLLRSIRRESKARDRSMTLYSPSNELVDRLKLTGSIEDYYIVDGDAVISSPEEPSAAAPPPPAIENDASTTPTQKVQTLVHSLRRSEHLEKGLDATAKCVAAILPQTPPERAGYEFAHLYEPSEKVGGDFFDYIALDDDHVGLCVGDVVGHGVEATLLMGITRKVLQLRATDDCDPSPARVLRRTSCDISDDLNKGSFVTALYGILELSSGAFAFARAGHEHPLVLSPDTPALESIDSRGAPLGLGALVRLGDVLEERTITLPHGSFLVLLTDGLPEARGPRGVQYGRDRLAFDLKDVTSEWSADDVLLRIRTAVRAFTGGSPQEDDITAMVIKRT